ncbi:MAG TPA: mannitol dehydrogenase [Clostridiales bacterium]|nr:mannitol dehydrogenase [Clostridiales bacterium]
MTDAEEMIMPKLVQYGAGNIGRGFIGPLFSEAGYEVVFIDINTEIVNQLNRDRAYPLRIVSPAGSRESMVKNVRAVHGTDQDAVAREIATAELLATSIGANILPRIAGNLAAGFRTRWQSAGGIAGAIRPLDILLCENLHHAASYMANWLREVLQPEEIPLFERSIGLVETSIGRMVPVMTPEMQEGNLLRVIAESYCLLPVDKAAFKGPVPEVPGLLPFSPFSFYTDRKLYIHNLGHAMAAYLGNIRKFTYIWEAVEDPAIRSVCISAMGESAAALSREYGIPFQEIQSHVDDLMQRFGNRMLGDTVDRVGRDTLRKLSAEDRLAGAVRLCQRNSIHPEHICMGIAAALLFDGEDPCTQTIQIMTREKGPETVLQSVCGLDPCSEGDAGIIQEICRQYRRQADQLEIRKSY